MSEESSRVRVAVLASGSGTNLQALIDRFHTAESEVEVVCVLSNRPDAGALRRAEANGIRGVCLPGSSPEEQDAALDELLGACGADLVVLAGYLRLVPPSIVREYRGRIVNIHPALLPAFGGAGMYGRHVQEAVLQRGARVTGATAHFVDAEYDQGPIILQWPVPVLDGDTPESLAARVLAVEHRLLPEAVEAVATGRVTLQPDRTCRWNGPRAQLNTFILSMES
ncbi:MAG: phosphoribosylglycinamide formyltransferase [Gemmatimonadota bacterium]